MKRQPSEIKREWYPAAEVGQIFGFTADTVLKGRAGFPRASSKPKWAGGVQKEACSGGRPRLKSVVIIRPLPGRH